MSSDDPSLNKDPAVTPNSFAPSTGLVQSSPKLPCDIIEDTVFPLVPTASNKKSMPPNFSHLKEAIVPAKDNCAGPNAKPASDNQKDGVSQPQENLSPEASSQTIKWTR